MSPDSADIRKRYETLLSLFVNEFSAGVGAKISDYIYISKELLHCAVNAYFDDIYKYKAYAGSSYADRHKQAAFTMIWISRFNPIQIKIGCKIDRSILTVNESFAIYAGMMFLDPVVMKNMTEKFYNHLVYMLTYRNIDGRGLATMMYLMETAAKNGVKY